jgi:hypothetical protein
MDQEFSLKITVAKGVSQDAHARYRYLMRVFPRARRLLASSTRDSSFFGVSSFGRLFGRGPLTSSK